jgi:hypothetical protein
MSEPITNDILKKLITQAEAETGIPILSQDKVALLAHTKLLNTVITFQTKNLDFFHNEFTENANTFINSTNQMSQGMANLSNPIRFADNSQAAAFNADSAKFHLYSISVTCATLLILAFSFWGFRTYNQQVQMDKFKFENPGTYRYYFKE